MVSLGGKHAFGSIGETRVTFVEKKIEEARKDFLVKLLEHNGFEVVVDELPRKNEEEPQLYTIGVTDMVFNPTVYIFNRSLKTFDDKKVTQDYWFQRTDDAKPQYWKND